MMRPIAVLVFICVAMCSGACGFPTVSSKGKRMDIALEPNLEVIRHIEVTLSLPQGARRLDSYVRYYSTETVAGEMTILGTYVYNGESGRVVRVRHDQLPQIEDGGCDVVEMRYSPKAGKVVSIFCHGVA